MIFLSVFAANAQSGGSYAITESVIATGGGSSAAGQYSTTGTSGQSLTGTQSTGGAYSVSGGFWQPVFTPTAANVGVSGRIMTANGNGIRGCIVTLTGGSGVSRSSLSTSFGYFRFDNVEAGQTYVIGIQSKRYQFANGTQIIPVTDEITDLVFTALPQ
jgi:hypothetical protein